MTFIVWAVSKDPEHDSESTSGQQGQSLFCTPCCPIIYATAMLQHGRIEDETLNNIHLSYCQYVLGRVRCEACMEAC